jgi:hypothetical protein
VRVAAPLRLRPVAAARLVLRTSGIAASGAAAAVSGISDCTLSSWGAGEALFLDLAHGTSHLALPVMAQARRGLHAGLVCRCCPHVKVRLCSCMVADSFNS